MVIKNGVVDGKYYVDGELVKAAGIVEWNGDFYFVTDSGKVYVGSIYVAASKTNGLIDSGKHTFDAEGKMTA